MIGMTGVCNPLAKAATAPNRGYWFVYDTDVPTGAFPIATAKTLLALLFLIRQYRIRNPVASNVVTPALVGTVLGNTVKSMV